MDKTEEKIAMINHVLSSLEASFEVQLRKICKDNNIYYPPKSYTSLRGSRNYDYLFKGLEYGQH